MKSGSKILYVMFLILCIFVVGAGLYLFLDTDNTEYKLVLKGFVNSSVEYGSDYADPFVLATINGVDASDQVIVEGIVDTYSPGEYLITYTLNTKKVIRKVTVNELRESSANIEGDASISVVYTISSLESTNEDIEITFEIYGSSYSSSSFYTEVFTEKSFTKTIEQNGEYEFIFYDKNNKTKTLKLEINNIDKETPVGSCTLRNTRDSSIITVDAKDASGIDYYSYNGKVYSDNVITITKEDNDNKLLQDVDGLLVYDKLGNSVQISCELKTDGMILIGDSRFVGIKEALKSNNIDSNSKNVYLVAKGGEYYKWFVNNAIGEVNKILESNKDKSFTILNNLGVNGLGEYYQKTDYFDRMNELMDGEWTGNKVGYISVNPWNSSNNTKIETFNALAKKTMKSGLYCDTYNNLTCYKSGELHYSSSCNLEIYNYIVDKCWF